MAVNYPFPYSFRILSDEEIELMKPLRPNTQKKDYLRIDGMNACISSLILEYGEILYNFKPRPDDIWLIGYQRSGTTLTQEILYLLGTDLNYEKASKEIMDIRFPILHKPLRGARPLGLTYESATLEEKTNFWSYKYLEELKEKRFIKSHLGFGMIHPEILEIGCKVVFIARNPKDVMASLARYPVFGTMAADWFKILWNFFKHGLFQGDYFEILESGWKRRHNKNLLFLFYEDINNDKKSGLLKIADFLGKKLTDDELEKLLKHLHIDSFKENKSLNNDHLVDSGLYVKNDEFSFIRKGKNGGWKSVFSQELVEEIDEWIKENLAKIPEFEVPETWKTAMDLKV